MKQNINYKDEVTLVLNSYLSVLNNVFCTSNRLKTKYLIKRYKKCILTVLIISIKQVRLKSVDL